MKTEPEEVFGELEPEDVFLARLAEIRRQCEARDKAAEEAAKPKIVASVSPKMADAIKANPTGLRLSIKDADEVVVVDRPRKTEVLEVLAVDRQGRPSRVGRFECATGQTSVLEYVGGYRPSAGAVSDYDVFATLKGSGE
jgi:hypothetical protein